MSNVRRVYVEKKEAYAVKAKELQEEIKSYLGITSVTGVRVLIRYDVENISEATYQRALVSVFSEPPVDDIYEETFDLKELYRCCEIARELTLKMNGVSAVSLPDLMSEKKRGEFVRTSNRHDYALKPTGLTALNALKDAGYSCISVGKIYDIFDSEV